MPIDAGLEPRVPKRKSPAVPSRLGGVPSIKRKVAASRRRIKIKVPAKPFRKQTGGSGVVAPPATGYDQYVSAPGQYVQPEVMQRLFPEISPGVINMAAGTGTRFTLGALTPNPRYLVNQNVLQMTPGGGTGSLAHEFVHFAQARAPQLLNQAALNPAQRWSANVGNRFMQLGASPPARFGLRDVAPALFGQNIAERAAFSIGGGQPSRPLPASYFQNLFTGRLSASQRQWNLGR